MAHPAELLNVRARRATRQESSITPTTPRRARSAGYWRRPSGPNGRALGVAFGEDRLPVPATPDSRGYLTGQGSDDGDEVAIVPARPKRARPSDLACHQGPHIEVAEFHGHEGDSHNGCQGQHEGSPTGGLLFFSTEQPAGTPLTFGGIEIDFSHRFPAWCCRSFMHRDTGAVELFLVTARHRGRRGGPYHARATRPMAVRPRATSRMALYEAPLMALFARP